MWTRWKVRLAQSRFIRKFIQQPADPDIFSKKPSSRFFIGLALMGLSYLLAWPLITLLGIMAVRQRRPALFAVGSPLAYGLSYLVFFLGVWLAGKEGLRYMDAIVRRLVGRFYRKYLLKHTDPSAHK